MCSLQLERRVNQLSQMGHWVSRVDVFGLRPGGDLVGDLGFSLSVLSVSEDVSVGGLETARVSGS